MTSPTSNDQQSQSNDQSQQQAAAAAKLRPGQPVTFRHTDPTTGEEFEGRGLVVHVGTDGASVAILPLSELHLEVGPDNVQPAKVSDLLPDFLRERIEATKAAV